MRYYSTHGKAPEVGILDAVMDGLAPDGGLYMPQDIPQLPAMIQRRLGGMDFPEIAFHCASLFFSPDVPETELREICEESFDFPVLIVPLADRIFSMELFHGPTLAFKDFAARFMARLMSYITRREEKQVTVLVATSGDTGSAVGYGFKAVEGIDVVILYPEGKVSHIQEMQLTTIGKNVCALEVEGSFDDCQRLVKQAFVDRDIQKARPIASANSINIARLIPQTFYYMYLATRMRVTGRPLYVSVPSGNFGNLTAGLIAKKMGAPIDHFIASSNRNDTVPRFLATGQYSPRVSVQTISNAMDVGDPSNFARMSALFGNEVESFSKVLSGASFSDEQTRKAIRDVYRKYGYLLDPHGAVGWLGMEQYQSAFPDHAAVVVETAHPAKFGDIVEPVIGKRVAIPDRLAACLDGEKQSKIIRNEYNELKSYLLQ